eukprot:403337664
MLQSEINSFRSSSASQIADQNIQKSYELLFYQREQILELIEFTETIILVQSQSQFDSPSPQCQEDTLTHADDIFELEMKVNLDYDLIKKLSLSTNDTLNQCEKHSNTFRTSRLGYQTPVKSRRDQRQASSVGSFSSDSVESQNPVKMLHIEQQLQKIFRHHHYRDQSVQCENNSTNSPTQKSSSKQNIKSYPTSQKPEVLKNLARILNFTTSQESNSNSKDNATICLQVQNLDDSVPQNRKSQQQNLYKSFSLKSPGMRPMLINNKDKFKSSEHEAIKLDLNNAKFVTDTKSNQIKLMTSPPQLKAFVNISKPQSDMDLLSKVYPVLQHNNSQVRPQLPLLIARNNKKNQDKQKLLTKKFADFLQKNKHQILNANSTVDNSPDKQSAASTNNSPNKNVLLNKQFCENKSVGIKKAMTRFLNFNPTHKLSE